MGWGLRPTGKAFNVIGRVDNRVMVLADAEKNWAEGTSFIV